MLQKRSEGELQDKWLKVKDLKSGARLVRLIIEVRVYKRYYTLLVQA